MSFDQWMKEVDDRVYMLAGCSVYDLPDYLCRDWYDDGMTPSEAAVWAIKEAA